ncbi:ribosome maturation factor RimM [Methyloligella sp. 2.7D]|uniref:ribosome maturation factor RimM n=1 Tax=unclassified Methyloligella TaxID=2625955 RepID=UPI00157C7809|nr:ribosome maturation factor RimM [Methyloligella sp. GL2]QKP76415.1 ribosome maturation factor RimM [Methyloligella sp. GL2]
MSGDGKPVERLLLGEIGAPHGLRGELRLRSYTAVPEDIAGYGPLEDESGQSRIQIAKLRQGPKGLLARFKGVESREAAERLTGTKLYIDHDKLPPSEEDEWYYADLIGLAVIEPDGTAIGDVVAVHDFGAGDLLEIAPTAGGPTELLAFTLETVPEVDIEAGKITFIRPTEFAARQGAEGEEE